MSRALSVYHGRFGRATLYELNRPMTTHAHREGHLIFYVGGGDGRVPVSGKLHGLTARYGVAVNPWEPHALHRRATSASGGLSTSSSTSTRAGSSAWAGSATAALHFGRSEIEMTPRIRAMVREVVSLLEDFDTAENFDGTLFELTDACFEQSWRLAGGWQRYCGPGVVLHRLPRAQVDRADVGAARLGDRARRRCARRRPVAAAFLQAVPPPDRRYAEHLPEHAAHGERRPADRPDRASRSPRSADELGFSCQSVFTRFFSSHVGMAPTDYRRAVQVLNG